MEEDDTREDPLYEWLRSEDLDGENGEPAEAIAQEASAQGVDVEGVLHRERTPEEAFDPLSRSQSQSSAKGASEISPQALSTSSSSRTKSGNDDVGGDDDDDDSGSESGGNNGGGGSSYPQSQRPLSSFTCEEGYTHATQDEDHGARPPIRRYERRSGIRKGKEPVKDNTLTSSMASVDLSDNRKESSSGLGDLSHSYPYEWSNDSGWYLNCLYPQPSSQPSQLNSASDYIQPYEYTSSDYPDSGVNSSTSYSLFSFPFPYEYESTCQQDDNELEEPARHSTWY